MKHIRESVWLPIVLLAAVTTACDEAANPLAAGGDEHNHDIPITEPLALLPVFMPFAVTQNVAVLDLGTLGSGTVHVARDVNAHGVVVGESADNSDNPHAFMWTFGTGMVDLGTTGGSESSAAAINDLNQIVGTSNDVNEVSEAFVYLAGTGMTGVGSIIGGEQSRGFGLSNSGHFVGSYEPVPFDPLDPLSYQGFRAWVFTIGSGFVEIPTLGSQFAGGLGVDVNDAGTVVGMSAAGDAGEPFEGFVYDAAGGVRAMGSMGANFSEHATFAINDAGEVAGGALNDGTGLFDPFAWSPQSGYTDLKTVGFPAAASGLAIDINRFGHMPILIQESSGMRTPTVWVKGVGTVTLPTLGGQDGEIWAINDLGMIVGWSADPAGQMRPAIWKLEFAPSERVEDVIDVVTTITDTALQNLVKDLDKAVGNLQDALDELAQGDGVKAALELESSVRDLLKAIGDGLDPIVGESLVVVVVEAARALAVGAIDDAIARGGDPLDIANAQQHLADADVDRDAGEWENAAMDYRKAVQDALMA